MASYAAVASNGASISSRPVPNQGISLQEYNDNTKRRPTHEQAIVFQIKKNVSNHIYLDKLNEHVKNKNSFIYLSRIAGDLLCVVFESASQAKMLIEEVGYIEVEEDKVQLKYFVAKPIKVYISNANYEISNSALKKFLMRDCGIRCASSVTKLKASGDPNDENRYDSMKSFRRVVCIHPDDADKLPKDPVRFFSPSSAYNVFFEIDSLKCSNFQQKDHFMAHCPLIKEGDKNKDTDSVSNDKTKDTFQHDLNENQNKNINITAQNSLDTHGD